MTVENTAPSTEAVNAPTIDSDSNQGVDSLEASSEATDLDSDPSESFEDWLIRKEGLKSKKVSSDESKAKETPKESKDSDSDEKPEEKGSIKSDRIKIKDKEYTQDEITERFANGEKAAQDLNKITKEATQFVNLLKTNPGEIFNKLGINKEVIEQWYYKTHLEPDLISPEERQARSEKEELESYRSESAKRKESEQAIKKEALKEQYRQEWSNKIQDALTKSDLPKTDWAISRIANYMKQALSKGMNHIQPADVIPLVKQDWENTQKQSLSSLTPEQLATVLGEETLLKLKKHEAEKYRQNKFQNSNPPKGQVREVKKPQGKRYKSPFDLLDE